VATEAAQAGDLSSADRCARRIQRTTARIASRRVRAQARCFLGGGTDCAAASVRAALGAACRTPSAAVCDTLACAPCDARGVAVCVGREVAAPADVLARTLWGQ
jgi:hypothetical protein